MIKFERIKIEGFGRIILPLKVKLDTHLVHVFRGENGAGKSSTFSALVWALYGEPLKAKSTITTYPELQPPGFMGTMVKVTFYKDGDLYAVVRCRNYRGKVQGVVGKNQVFLFKNGEVVQTRKKRDVNAEIVEVLGYTRAVFLNAVVFSQRGKRFLSADMVERKRILEDSFNTGFIQQAKSKAQESLRKLQQQISLTLAESHEVELQLTNIKSERVVKTETLKATISEKETHLGSLRKDIKHLQKWLDKTYKEEEYYNTEVGKLESRLLELKTTEEEVSLLKAKKEKLEVSLRSKEKTLAEYKDAYSEESAKVSLYRKLSLPKKGVDNSTQGVCPLCGSKLTTHSSEKLRETQKAERQVNRAKWNKAKRKLGDIEVSISNTKNKITSARERLLEVVAKLSYYQQEIGVVAAKKDSLSKELKGLLYHSAELTKKRAEIKTCKKEILGLEDKFATVSKVTSEEEKLEESAQLYSKQLKALYKDRDNHEWVTNRVLSNRGLKNYLFSAMLNKLNARLAKYAQLTRFKVEVVVDEDSANKNVVVLVTEGGVLVPEADLSGGEAQLIDILISFGIGEIANTVNNTNLIIMDETFEGLDEANVEAINTLLKSKAKGKTLFVITHLKTFMLPGAVIHDVKRGEDGSTRVF